MDHFPCWNRNLLADNLAKSAAKKNTIDLNVKQK